MLITLSSCELAGVTGGNGEAVDPELERALKATGWYRNVLRAGQAMGEKGSTYGAIIGFGAAAAGGVTLPAAGLAALAGSGKGYVLGFATGAGAEVVRTWSDRPWK